MILPSNVNFVAFTIDYREFYAIYSHSDVDGVIRYIGVDRLSELFRLSEAMNNSKWSEYFGPDQILNLKIHGLTKIEHEANKYAHDLIVQHRPICNVRGFYMKREKMHVKCIDTGEIFRTLRECADNHKLTYSALNAHVNDKPGHRQVKGRRYCWTTEAVNAGRFL